MDGCSRELARVNGSLSFFCKKVGHTVCRHGSLHLHIFLSRMCVCVVIPFILDIRLVDVPAGVKQEEGHTGFIHLLSAVLALILIEKDSAVPFPRRP